MLPIVRKWPPPPSVPMTRRGDGLLARLHDLAQLHQVRRQVTAGKRFKGAPIYALPVLLGDSSPTAGDESALVRALHAAAQAKYAATHGPKPDPAAAAAAAQQMATLSRAYLALGHTSDELERLKSATLLDRASDTLAQLGKVLALVGILGVGGYILVTRPARRMDF